MFRLLLLAMFAATVFGLPFRHSPAGGRLSGGEDASIQEAPYQAALLHGGFLICGASIITANIVVSAAHCVIDGASSYIVRAGTDRDITGSGQNVGISRILVHEDYDDWEIDYDISLIFLSAALNLDGVIISSITLPVQGQTIPDGALGFVTGWGTLTEDGDFPITLQKLTIPIINQQSCVRSYSNQEWLVTDRMICAGLEAGGKDACQGDSGGPLVIDSQLIGITSWGNGCARAGYPGVWTRVPFFIDWINKNAGI